MAVHGMSECGGIFQWTYPDGISSIPFYQDISALGSVSPGARIRMLSPEGEVVPRGEVGEFHVSHSSIFKTYLREQTETPELYTDETGRWFNTGDLGIISESGDVYIVGRLKSVIKRAAVSIAPAAIESCLQAYIGSQVSALRHLLACFILTRIVDGRYWNASRNPWTRTVCHRGGLQRQIH
jgi:4-coumarate--CoA ligase